MEERSSAGILGPRKRLANAIGVNEKEKQSVTVGSVYSKMLLVSGKVELMSLCVFGSFGTSTSTP